MLRRNKILLVVLIPLAVSCKKENSSIPSSATTTESLSQELLTEQQGFAAEIKTVTIGTQVWMKKNWRGNRYRNGDLIPQVKDPAAWGTLTTGAWCWYDNDSANGAVYGRLYNWYAVTDPRGLAPEGWHIPSDGEWKILTDFLGGDTLAGGKMKSTGTIEAGTGLWRTPNEGATDSSGFAALPGGDRGYHGKYTHMGEYGAWWSTTDYGIAYARFRLLLYSDNNVYRLIFFNKLAGLSVRCIKD